MSFLSKFRAIESSNILTRSNLESRLHQYVWRSSFHLRIPRTNSSSTLSILFVLFSCDLPSKEKKLWILIMVINVDFWISKVMILSSRQYVQEQRINCRRIAGIISFIPGAGWMRPSVGREAPKLRRLWLDLQTTAEPQVGTKPHNTAQPNGSRIARSSGTQRGIYISLRWTRKNKGVKDTMQHRLRQTIWGYQFMIIKT
jgi:hypothetical protein